MTIATNNVAFAFAGAYRRVLLRNALHFLSESETELLARMPRRFHAQIPVVRRLVTRADLVVTPSSAMAERVRRLVPSVRDRLVVRPHPVTPVGPRLPTERPFILVPVVSNPSSLDLASQLHLLLEAIARVGQRIDVQVTARPADLPPALVHHPRLSALGVMPHRALSGLWRMATAVFYPRTCESFGYPLAEARVYGVPVIAPDTELAREVAGPALLPYHVRDLESLAAAVAMIDHPVRSEPHMFNQAAYFRWLLGPPTTE